MVFILVMMTWSPCEDDFLFWDVFKGCFFPGFAKQSQVELSQIIGDGSWILVATDGKSPGAVALSSIIQACTRSQRVLITRYAYNKVANVTL